jgi:hypothetical protein
VTEELTENINMKPDVLSKDFTVMGNYFISALNLIEVPEILYEYSYGRDGFLSAVDT